MERVTDIHELAAQVLAAQHQFDAAMSAVEADKRERATSLIARLVDAITTTKPESALRDAEIRLVVATSQAREATRAWIIDTARQRLAENPVEAERHQEQAQKVERAQGRAKQVRRWLKLAQDADTKLMAARSACGSASATELLDLATTDNAISALSYMSTSGAAGAVQNAALAVQALANALPKRAEQVGISQPDDRLDFIVDLAFEHNFDLLSLFNIGRLADASRQCERVAEKLRPLLWRLHRAAHAAEANAKRERAALHAIEAPYLEAAAAQVPEVLRVPTPEGFA